MAVRQTYGFNSEGGAHICGRSKAVSGTYTVLLSDYILFCDTSGGNVTLNLPAASSAKNMFLEIKGNSSGANNIIIDPSGAETIEGLTTLTLQSVFQYAYIWCDGSAWYLFQQEVAQNNLIYSLTNSFSSTASVYTTVMDSASTFFTGRPYLFFMTATFSTGNNDVIFQEEFALQIDGAGTSYSICRKEMHRTVAGFHTQAAGSRILTPTRGNHTIRIQAKRNVGTGTCDIDNSDLITLSCISV